MLFTSKEKICNVALVKNGGKTITNINSLNDPNSILMKELYDPTLFLLLAETFWMFSTARINAVVVGGSTVELSDQAEWVTATGYAFGSTIKESTTTEDVYYCIKDHSAWATLEFYKVGMCVTYGSNVYICIADNYSTSSLLPTDITYWLLTGTSADTNPKSGTDKDTFWWKLTESGTDSGTYLIDLVENEWSTWGLDVIYQVPPDMIRLIGWSDPNAVIRQEGKYFLSDSEGLGILYNYFNENVTQFPAHFVQTFIDKLRADSCQKLTGSNSKTVYWTEYWEEKSLPKAKAIDSQGETSVSPKKNAWTNSKYNGVATTGKRKLYYR